MTSTNDGRDVKSNQSSGQKGKSYYIELYKSLDARLSGDCDLSARTRHLCEAWRRVHSLCLHALPATHPHLFSWIEKHTARTILQTEWQSPKSKEEQTSLKEAIDAYIAEAESGAASKDGVQLSWEIQLQQRGEWFQRILYNPWGHDVLRALLQGETPGDDEILGWLKEERGVMFVTRLKQLTASKSKCDDLAMGLVTTVMDRVRAFTVLIPDNEQVEETKDTPTESRDQPTFEDVLKAEAGFTSDIWELLTDLEFVLLHKCDRHSKCIELAKQIPLRNGYHLVERLQSRLETAPREKRLWKNAKDVATLVAQVIVARCMVVPACSAACRSALYCCSRALARLLAPGRLPAAAAALAAPAATARHLHTLAQAVDAQLQARNSSSTEMIPFICELYVRAITAGMNELERFKLKTEKEADARASEATLSAWFTQLGALLACSERVRCECALTAFSLHPAPDMFDRVRLAPLLPRLPAARDTQETTGETTSEFGSWTTDSRTQSNLVKTSETLNIKHTRNQANVLSTAILTEGEAIGLSPELCQDLAVLLSGPRVKTLSWDMDREVLLENCRVYMERTHGGTRALTTELKYLNLDPSSYMHLPEEKDEEDDLYYGIEKGYEHLVELQEPESAWQDPLEDLEVTESACSSSMENDNFVVRRKKNAKRLEQLSDSEEDSDPLSLIAEVKRTEKKKERPLSKERSSKDSSKERKKKTKSKETSDNKEGSRERRKENPEDKDKEKKKEKKLRKKNIKDSQQVQPKPGSLSSLIGMKVAKVKIPDGKYKKSPDMKGMPYVTDSDYDSQGKSSLASLNSEGNDPDVLFDGLFCMEDYSSTENDPLADKNSLSNSELSVANGRVTINTAQQVKKPEENKPAPQIRQYTKNNQAKSVTSQLNNVPSIQTSVEQTQSAGDHKTQAKNVNVVREQVKKSISRLIEFRRQNSLLEAQSHSLSSPSSTASSPRVITESIPAVYKSPNAIVRNDPPLIISPKALAVPDIPKLYINKTQTESEPPADMNAKHQNKPVIQYPYRYTQPQTVNYSDVFLQSLKKQENVRPAKPQPSAFNYTQSPISDDIAQKNFQAFLKELQETINAGTGAKKEPVPPLVPNMLQKKEIRPISRVTPVFPKNMKPEPGTSSQCAKSTIQTAKKADNQLNTFARLSYMHKTKQSDSRTSKDSPLPYQDPMVNLNRSIEEQKSAKLKYLQSKGDLVVSRVGQAPHNLSIKDEAKGHIKNVDNPSITSIRDHPMLANMLQTNTTYGAIPKHLPKQDNSVRNSLYQKEKPRAMTPAPVPRESSLSEKDQNDLLLLLRQQNKLNYPTTYINPDVNKITNNIQYSNNPVPASTISSRNQPPILNIPAKKNYSTEIKHMNTQNYDYDANKATHVKPVHVYSKSVDSKQDNTKSIPYNKINVSMTKVPNVVTRNAEFNQFNQYGLNNEQDTKSNVLQKAESNRQDWESVMDALLKHKTPSRGPTALEMTLKKEGLSNSSLRNQRIMRTNNVVDSEAKTNERLQTQTVLKHTTSETLVRPNVVVEGSKAVENKRHNKQTAKHVMPERVVRPNPALNTEVKPTLQTQRIVRPSLTIDAEVKTGDNKTHIRTVPKPVMPERIVRPTIIRDADIKRSDYSKLQAYTPAKQVIPEKVNRPTLILDAEVKNGEARKAPNIIRNVITERIVRPSLNFNASVKPDERSKVQHIHTTDKIVRPNLVSQVKIDDPIIVAKHVMPAVIHKKTSIIYSATEDSLKNHKQPQTQTQAVKPPVLGEQIKRNEVPKKQGANTFVKDKDCCISGIPNSDYDLLDELIDDELRQEIGEISSDEETYRASSANNLKGNKISKDSNVVKNTKPQDSLHAVNLRCALKPAQNSVIIQANTQLVKCNSTPKVIIECDRTIVPARFTDAQGELHVPQVQQNTSRPLAKSITQQPTANAVVLNNQTNENQAFFCQNINRTHINVVDPRNVIITAVPQPVIPKVVLLGSDVVYEPFTTVQTHLQTGLCNVNQTPYVTLNAAPNITLYQTTQFAAPVVNEVIIGNAMTMPIPAAASEKITSMTCKSQDMSTTQTIETDPAATVKDSPKEAVSSDHNISDNVNLETKPKIIVDHLLHGKPDVVEPKSSLDINSNENCERRVLSEVQDKQKLNLIEKVDVKNTSQKLAEEKVVEKVTIQTEFKLEREPKIVIEHAAKYNLKDDERLKKKRLAILNREVNHRSCADPIPLSYAPLFKPIQQSPVSNTPLAQHKADNTITPNLVRNNHKVLNEEPNTDNSKENKDKKTPCRRIMLRSSNDLKAVTGSLSSQDQRNPVGRKTKVRLKKTEEQCTDKTVEQKVNIDNVDIHKNEKIDSPIRMSKRILNKKVEKNNTEVINADIVEAVVINEKQKKNCDNNQIQNTLKDVKHADIDQNKVKTDGLKEVDNTDTNKFIGITTACKPVDNKPKLMPNTLEFDVIDIEDALQGSKIPKVSVRSENTASNNNSTKSSPITGVEKKTNKRKKATKKRTGRVVREVQSDIKNLETKSKDNELSTDDANKSIKINDASNVIIETKSSKDKKLNTNEATESIKKNDTSGVIIETKSSTDNKLNTNDVNKSIKKNYISNVIIETKSSTDNKLNTDDANKSIKKTNASTVTIVPTPQTALGDQIESISILNRAIKTMQTINKTVLPIVQANKDKIQKKLIKKSGIDTVKEINPTEPLNKSCVVKEAREVKTPQTKPSDLVKTVKANNTCIIANEKNKQSIAPTSSTINVPQVTDNTTKLLGPLIEGKGKNLSNNKSQISKPEQNSNLPVKANILTSNVSNIGRNNIIDIGENSIIQNKTLNQENHISSKNGDLSGNDQTQKNEQSTLESLRDQIRIEEFPALANEPDKRCVRIKMPDGKSFKATVYGKMHVSFESLFSDQSLRTALLKSINNTKRYTVNIKQVSTAPKNDPSKIVETRIEEVKVQTNFSQSIETVNLLSDDEDGPPSPTNHKTQTLKTAFGEFNVSSLDEAEFNKHQHKLQQKCLIKLTDIKTSHPHLLSKESFKAVENIIQTESETNTNQSILSSPLSVKQDEVKRTQLSIDVNDTIKDNSFLPIVPEQESVPRQSLDEIVVPDLPACFNPNVIEIDDSSNDSVPEAREVPLLLCSETKTKELVLADCSIKELPGDIDNLKTLLLKDLGVNDIASKIEKPKQDDSTIELLKDTTNQTCVEKIRECYVRLHNCDDLVKQYDQVKIINQKCTVSLYRCDDQFEKDNISVDEDVYNLSDDFINLDTIESEPKLTKSGSFSLLDNESIFEENILDNSSHLIDCGRSSPVMEVFDTISSLRKATLATEDHLSVMEAFDLIACHQKPIRKVVTEQIRCFCDWYPTKRDLHLYGKEELLLEAQPSIKNIPLFYESTFNSYIDKKSDLVPTLKKLTANLFLGNTIIDQIRPYYIKNVKPIQSPSHSLKRKILNGEDKSVASKLVKVTINTNVQDIKIQKENTSPKETAEKDTFVLSKIQDGDRNVCVTSTTLDENVTQIKHPSVDQASITNIDNSQSSRCVNQGEGVNSEAAIVSHSNGNLTESDVQNDVLNEDPDDSRAENDEKFPTKRIHNNESTGPADVSQTEAYDTTKYEKLVESVTQLHSDNTHVSNIEETKSESIERFSSPEIDKRPQNASQNENDSNIILDHLVDVNEDKLIVKDTLTDTIQALDAVPKCKLGEANATCIENCNEGSAISCVKDEGDVSPNEVTRQIDGIDSSIHTAYNCHENIEEYEIQNYFKRPRDCFNSDNIENEVEKAAIKTVSSEKMEQPNLIVNTQENLTKSDNKNTLIRQCNIELIECKEVNAIDLENVHFTNDTCKSMQSDTESKTSDVAKPVDKSDNKIVKENMSHLTVTSETCHKPLVSSKTKNIINYDSNQDSIIASNEYQTDFRKLALTDKELNKEDPNDSRSENKANTNTVDESYSEIDNSNHYQSDHFQSRDHQCTESSTDIEDYCNKDISGILDIIPDYQESKPVSGSHKAIESRNKPDLELVTVVEEVSNYDSSVDCLLKGNKNTAQTDSKLYDDVLEKHLLKKVDTQEIESLGEICTSSEKIASTPKKDSNIKTSKNENDGYVENKEDEVVEKLVSDKIDDSQDDDDDDSQNSEILIKPDKYATSVKVDSTTELEFLATSPEKGKQIIKNTETQPSPNHRYTLKELYLKDKTDINESKHNNEFILNGIEYEDPEVGTCYVFPIADTSSSSCDTDDIFEEETEEIMQVIQEISEDGTVASLTLETKEMSADEDYFKLNLPKLTYSRLRNSDTYMKASKRPLKRKIDMSDVKISEKKYRKGKNIDYPKITVTAMADSAYGREFKRIYDYCSTLKFSFSQPYHKEFIDVDEIIRNWPIGLSICDDLQGEFHDAILFTDLDNFEPHKVFDPEDQSLADEISAEYSESDLPSNAPETNFSMGFGEGSDRVLQNLEEVGDDSIFSAATLSDVKQTQPFLLSENYNECKADQEEASFKTIREDQIKLLKRYLTYIQMRDKVRSFFKKTSMELKYDWIRQNKRSNKYDVRSFPFELYNKPDFLEPPPTNVVVQVVQVGQLPVSAAAQNPVTCDPRVTQVSDASPSQCSVDNSPQDDSQPTIKTEYTELTTADLTVPLMQEYAQHHQTFPMDPQEPTDMSMTGENIPIETEIKSVVKIELMDNTEEKEEPRDNYENCEAPLLEAKQENDVDYSFDANSDPPLPPLEPPPEAETDYHVAMMDYPQEKQDVPDTYPVQEEEKQRNGAPEKTDQIAHAMNAAGITTTSETMTNNTRAHALVNLLSQKLRQAPAGTGQASNTYSKTTSINAMALQQALAQILPPPLNQTNGSDNNQQAQNTPQVLHIVQGKNASGSQITLVDNTQQSVINAPNATPVLHIVQNKSGTANATTNGSGTPQTNSFGGLSLVDAGLQQGGNQLLHIVNTGSQKNSNTAGQLLKRVNLLTNLANVQGSNEQKMVQFVCKSADGKAIQLNAPHQRSMVLRLQPIETPNVQATPQKPVESQDLSPTSTATNLLNEKDAASQQEIKSRSIYEENYAKFIQNSSSKTGGSEKSTSLPKFNQAFGKPVFQDGNPTQNDVNANNSHLSINTKTEPSDCQTTDSAINLDHIGQISSPPLLLRKSPAQTSQPQPNLVQQLKQTITPMNIQTMHGGVIYTRQIPVNIGGGQTINLITVPSTELVDDSAQKHQPSQNEMEQSIIKLVPQNQSAPPNAEISSEEGGAPINVSNENNQNPQPQPVLTQMRIKLPMLSKAPQMVSGARVVRPSFFQIQRNVIGGTNQPVYQQLVLTAAPPLGQQTIRLPQAQTARQIKVDNQSSAESQMSSSTLEQLREFDMVLEQVKERSSVPPNSSSTTFPKLHTPSTDTTDGSASSSSTETTQQVLYSIGNNHQPLNVAYVNRKATVSTPTTSTFVRSPDSSGIIDSPTSSTHVQIPHTVTSESSHKEPPPQPKPKSKSKSRPKASSNPPNNLKLNTVPPKTSSQKPLEDEQTTQRILYILAEYKEQVENSPDKDKPAPRRRTNPPSNPSGSSKRKKSSSGSRRHGRDHSPIHGEDTCRTMGSEDSSCGTSQGDCNESCLESHSPQDSPRKVVRKLTFEQENPAPTPRPQPQRNVIVADGQTITVARGTAGKPTTAVLMPANYILPVSMVKGGQQIAIVTNRGPKLLTVGGGEGGATNALLLQRLIGGPAGLKPVLARQGVRHVRLPTAALHNLQAFNLATATTIQPPDSTASPAPAPTPPELVDTRATSSPWTDRDCTDVKPERDSSPEGSGPWNLPSSGDPHDYSYEETVRADHLDRTVLGPIPDRYSPDMEAQRIFDKMFDVESKKSYMGDSPRCAYDIDESDCDDKPYHQVVQKKDGSSYRQHRLTHVSAAALRHKYAILEHELRLQKSLSEECEDLGVDSPSASELFPEAELLFATSPAHDHTQDQGHHSHTPQPTIMNQCGIPHPDMDDQIATDQLLTRDVHEDQQDLKFGLEDVGIVTVSEDGMQATIALDQEEFARSHPNTTFHSEPEEGEVQPFTITGLKGRHIPTIFHSNRAPATVLMTAPQTTVISQATGGHNHSEAVKYADIDNMINSLPSSNNNINLSSVLVKDEGLTRFDSILSDSRELHLSNTASAIVHSGGNATQVIRRVCYDDDKRDRFLMDEPDGLIAGDDAKMIAEDSSRDATLESMGGDVDDDRSSPERHTELFWESNSASERSESRRPLDFSSDSEKCCKSPSYDETNSTDSSGVGTHMRLDSVIKDARGIERSGSADGSSADDTHPPLRTYPPKRMYGPLDNSLERSLTGKTRAGEISDLGMGREILEARGGRRASGRGVVKRGCPCCNGSPAPPKPKKSRQRKPTMDFTTN